MLKLNLDLDGSDVRLASTGKGRSTHSFSATAPIRASSCPGRGRVA